MLESCDTGYAENTDETNHDQGRPLKKLSPFALLASLNRRSLGLRSKRSGSQTARKMGRGGEGTLSPHFSRGLRSGTLAAHASGALALLCQGSVG